jgi:hypothetical protein
MTQQIQLALIQKPGCHLCDDARLVIQAVLGQFQEANPAVKVQFTEQDILEDEELYKRYWEEIPVLLINNKIHNYWKIDPVRLRASLDELV